MQLLRRIGIITVITILLASCTPVELMVGGDEKTVQPVESSSEISVQALEAQETIEPAEVNECLNCHSDKNRLIETTAPVEEVAESESSGVG